MKPTGKTAVIVMLSIFCTLGTMASAPRSKKVVLSNEDVTVLAFKSDGKLVCEINQTPYTQKQCAFVLGELRTTHEASVKVRFMIDDQVELATISDLGHMAVEAGFVNVQAYVCWLRTHHMAEIQFGPVSRIPASLDPKR